MTCDYFSYSMDDTEAAMGWGACEKFGGKCVNEEDCLECAHNTEDDD